MKALFIVKIPSRDKREGSKIGQIIWNFFGATKCVHVFFFTLWRDSQGCKCIVSGKSTNASQNNDGSEKMGDG